MKVQQLLIPLLTVAAITILVVAVLAQEQVTPTPQLTATPTQSSEAQSPTVTTLPEAENGAATSKPAHYD